MSLSFLKLHFRKHLTLVWETKLSLCGNVQDQFFKCLSTATAEIEVWEPDVFGSDRSIFKMGRAGATTYSDSGNLTEGV